MFKGRHFDRSIILLCVRWYLAYGLSLPDLREMMAERGISVDHVRVGNLGVRCGIPPELLDLAGEQEKRRPKAAIRWMAYPRHPAHKWRTLPHLGRRPMKFAGRSGNATSIDGSLAPVVRQRPAIRWRIRDHDHLDPSAARVLAHLYSTLNRNSLASPSSESRTDFPSAGFARRDLSPSVPNCSGLAVASAG